jgi:ABC-type proline/glycine betaine transport system permease subunit
VRLDKLTNYYILLVATVSILNLVYAMYLGVWVGYGFNLVKAWLFLYAGMLLGIFAFVMKIGFMVLDIYKKFNKKKVR